MATNEDIITATETEIFKIDKYLISEENQHNMIKRNIKKAKQYVKRMAPNMGSMTNVLQGGLFKMAQSCVTVCSF